MAHIPPEHEKYNLLPRSCEGGWEVISYPSFLYEIDEALADIELGPRSTPSEPRPSLLTPYGYKDLEEYLAVIESFRRKHIALAGELSRLAKRIVEMNRKEYWSVLRYVGPAIPDTIFGLTPGRCYYWPTSKSFPFYEGVIDDEEFTSYASYSLAPEHWEILKDPTGMAKDILTGLRSTLRTDLPKNSRFLSSTDLRLLHKLCRCHVDVLAKSSVCGCFYCCTVFPASSVSEFIEDGDEGDTGLCPYCGIDALLPSFAVEAAGFPLDTSLLFQMERYWFGQLSKRTGSLCWGLPTSIGMLEAKINGSLIPFRAFQDVSPKDKDLATPFWCIDLDAQDFAIGDVVTIGVSGANFTYDCGDERCELLVTKTGDTHIGFCGYDPAYHGDCEALLHCYELSGFSHDGFTYEIVRDPVLLRCKSGHSTSIPLAICEIKEEIFEHDLSAYYEDISTALLFVTSFHVC